MAIATNLSTSSSIVDALSYGSNPAKRGTTIAFNCNSKHAARDFSMPFETYGKTQDKVKLHRLVLSFSNDSKGSCELNSYDMKEYVRKFLSVTSNYLGGNYPLIAYEHLNTNHPHYHIYIGACGFDGRKLHPKQNPITFSRRLNASLSRQYGLKLMPSYQRDYRNIYQFTDEQIKNYASRHSGQVPYSYKDAGRQLVSRAILKSNSLDSFKKEMENLGCRVSNNLYSDSKMMNFYIPFRYKNGIRKKKQKFRNLRSKTLGIGFSKSEIKKAIYSVNDKSLDKYRFFARDQKTVQGGKIELEHKPTIIAHDKASSHMKNVRYKNPKMNYVHGIDYGLSAMHSNFNFSSMDFLMPMLVGVSSEERQTIIEEYKLLQSISSEFDRVINSSGSIFHNFAKKVTHNMDSLNSFNDRTYYHGQNGMQMKFDYNNTNNRNKENVDDNKAQSQNKSFDLNNVDSRQNMINLIKKTYDDSDSDKRRYILSLSMMADVNSKRFSAFSNYYQRVKKNDSAIHGFHDLDFNNRNVGTPLSQTLHEVKQVSKNMGSTSFIDDAFAKYSTEFKGKEFLTKILEIDPLKDISARYGPGIREERKKRERARIRYDKERNKKVEYNHSRKNKQHEHSDWHPYLKSGNDDNSFQQGKGIHW